MTRAATAVLLASAPAPGAAPPGALAWEDTTVAERLADQLRSLGVADVRRMKDGATGVTQLRRIAALARDARGPLVVARADVVTQREALAGLLDDPRIATGALVGGLHAGGGRPVRDQEGRIVSAASPQHDVGRPTGRFLGVLKVAPADLPALAKAADAAAAFAQRGGAAEDDPVALLLVALVRSEVQVAPALLRELFWARPRDAAEVARAQAQIGRHDEDRALLDSAVKASDGFFTTFFVSPYSKHLARWAARRGLTPNQVTTISLAVGALAAAAFATGARWGLVAGALLLQAAFTADCVDGQLARYTRTFTALGAWLDSMFDRAKEYLVFAGLGIGAARSGDPVWALAGAALALQTVRHALDFSFAATEQQDVLLDARLPLERRDDGMASAPRARRAGRAGAVLGAWRGIERRPAVVWLKRIVVLPIGERFAVISLTAALFVPRTTFIVLLAWGGVALAYGLTGRGLRALAR